MIQLSKRDSRSHLRRQSTRHMQVTTHRTSYSLYPTSDGVHSHEPRGATPSSRLRIRPPCIIHQPRSSRQRTKQRSATHVAAHNVLHSAQPCMPLPHRALLTKVEVAGSSLLCKVGSSPPEIIVTCTCMQRCQAPTCTHDAHHADTVKRRRAHHGRRGASAQRACRPPVRR